MISKQSDGRTVIPKSVHRTKRRFLKDDIASQSRQSSCGIKPQEY